MTSKNQPETGWHSDLFVLCYRIIHSYNYQCKYRYVSIM